MLRTRAPLILHTVIPMHYLTFPLLKGNYEDFVKELEKWGVKDKKVIDSYKDLLGKWTDL